VNAQLVSNLTKHFDLTYVGPISPRSDYPSKLVSKVKRVTGGAGRFHFFSRRRLKSIARLVNSKINHDVSYNFFLGSTPWVSFESTMPYGAYLDACFWSYINIYHDRSSFLEEDIQEICDLEARWLSKADQVFFSTKWALDETVKAYGIPTRNLHVVGIAGNVPIPLHPAKNVGRRFLFIALEFERKGGRLCCDAVERVRITHPDAELMILGERPPSSFLTLPGVNYGGYLRKTVPSELSEFQSILSSAYALVHPTTMDTNPMVLIEAGYHGCPSVAPRSFGIPELIKDGVTGFIVDHPLTADAFATCMLRLLNDEGSYRQMRQRVREFSQSNLSWESVVGRITAIISESLPRASASENNSNEARAVPLPRVQLTSENVLNQ
jgi:glycosyltransferase involved in cell wall biosynthesis